MLPSSTFLNLPPEKRETLLTAAVREFTEYPYNEASINRIIRAAHIPRGSFYMYFRDKEELFRYLLRESIERLLALLREVLREQKGDIFAALPALYDALEGRQTEGDTGLGSIGLLTIIVNRNCGLQMHGLMEFIDPDDIVERVAEDVDPSLLDLREERDLNDILRTLLIMTIPIMYHGMRPGGDLDGRDALRRVLKILRRGMDAKPTPIDHK